MNAAITREWWKLLEVHSEITWMLQLTKQGETSGGAFWNHMTIAITREWWNLPRYNLCWFCWPFLYMLIGNFLQRRISVIQQWWSKKQSCCQQFDWCTWSLVSNKLYGDRSSWGRESRSTKTFNCFIQKNPNVWLALSEFWTTIYPTTFALAVYLHR